MAHTDDAVVRTFTRQEVSRPNAAVRVYELSLPVETRKELSAGVESLAVRVDVSVPQAEGPPTHRD